MANNTPISRDKKQEKAAFRKGMGDNDSFIKRLQNVQLLAGERVQLVVRYWLFPMDSNSIRCLYFLLPVYTHILLFGCVSMPFFSFLSNNSSSVLSFFGVSCFLP